MEKTIKTIGNGLLLLLIIDLWILSMSMAQVAVEGRSGYWNSWWSWQANTVMRVLK